jgi:hypothetical protein
MNHLRELELRREELLERSQAQRAALVAGLSPLADRLGAVDRAVASVRRYPMISAAIAAAVVLLGSRRMFGWIARGITLYTLLKKV